jgi:16S rRNA (guanine1207-N2)-methyltransferase
MNSPHALYGIPPRSVQVMDALHADAVQYSPLIPDAHALEDCAPNSLASALLLAPPGTLERRYVLACALRALAIDTPLTALALKEKGGNRIADELKQFGCTVTQDSHSHFRFCTTTRPAVLTAIDDALTQGGPQPHPTHGLWTQPGIFSWDRIDPASALLLKHLPVFRGAGADLGCGLGILSRAALTSVNVTALTLIDIDRRAVNAARRNITDPRAHFLWADMRSDLPAITPLDFVVMNPPFHDNGIEDKTLGQHFITRAAALLKRGGTCWLTANRHLPYEALLAKQFSRVETIAEADGFKIIAAEK